MLLCCFSDFSTSKLSHIKLVLQDVQHTYLGTWFKITDRSVAPEFDYLDDVLSRDRAAEARVKGNHDVAAIFERLCDCQNGYCP